MPFLLIGLGFGIFVGHAVGKSSAQERIHALQQEMLKLAGLIAQRDAEIAGLLAWRAQVEREVAIVQSQRSALSRTEWAAAEHPEVVRRKQIRQLDAHVGLLQAQGAAGRQRLSELRQQVQ